MNEYEVTWPDAYDDYPYDMRSNHVARTPAAARYRFFQHHDLGELGYEYSELFRKLKSRLVRKGVDPIKEFYPKSDSDILTWEAMVKDRGIGHFAFIGQKVNIDGEMGTIVGACQGLNLRVVMDGDSWVSNAHPTWETTYFDSDGNVAKDYKKI